MAGVSDGVVIGSAIVKKSAVERRGIKRVSSQIKRGNKMNEVSDRKLAQLNTLMELTALVNSTLDTHEVRKRAIEAATRLVNAETGSLILKDKENNELF